jgi:iron complex outermembrane receptor protein
VALLWFLAIAQAPTGGLRAQETAHDLADMSIEELMNESVTSAGKKHTRLGDAPTAISVITQDEIRRSGYNSIPELLRLVPGVNVARVDGNEWAISSRGFNGQYANKLLVLIDGRTVYTPTSGGVYWNVQDTLLEDIDRIEVIRGPGATLWGANAVNGVINIITKAARDTQGGLLSMETGTEDRPAVGARYGGQLDSTLQYRVYGKYFDRQPFESTAGNDVTDGQHAIRGGVRVDWQPASDDRGTLSADYYDSDSHKPVTLTSFKPPYATEENSVAHNAGVDVVGSWDHSFSGSSQLTVQSYLQHFSQNFGYGVERQDSYDIEVQHHAALGGRHDVVWGMGYRYTSVRDTSSATLIWTPERENLNLYQAFLQDEITLIPDHWRLVLGSKLEHNSLTGLEVEPSGRVLWTPTLTTTIWGAVSDSTRTPALFEHGSQLNVAVIPSSSGPPVWVQLLGNPEVEEEQLRAYELGYRFQPSHRWSFDMAAFYNSYRDLLTYIGNEPGFEFYPQPHILISSTIQNVGKAQTYGVEVSAQWQVLPDWRLIGSYSGLRMHTQPHLAAEGESPQHQAQLRSYLDLPRHIEINAAAMYVDAITVVPTAAPVRIASYVRVDLGASWHPVEALEVAVWGQNLLQSRHPEFPSVQTPLQIEIPRSALVRITWHF